MDHETVNKNAHNVMRWLNHIRNLEQNSWKHENFKGGTMMNVNGTMIIFDGSVNNACGTMYNAYKTMCK